MVKESLSDHLINQYRNLVKARYQYKKLGQRFVLPDSINKERVEAIQSYFLNYVYPDAQKRKLLVNAFQHLDKYFKNPKTLLRLIGNASGIVFKFGFQFPKALKAGMTSLESFKAAATFEAGLLKEAKKQKMVQPITLKEFEGLVKALPEKETRKFIDEFDQLLGALVDTKLLKKTVEIMDELINQMKKLPELYDEKDVAGISIGRDILHQGYLLFHKMNSEEKQEVIEMIVKAEHHFMDEIYGV